MNDHRSPSANANATTAAGGATADIDADSLIGPGAPAPGSPIYPNLSDSSNTASAILDSDRQQQERAWRDELESLEREIATLRSVLNNKMRRAGELKQRLGITIWREVKNDISSGITDIKTSDTYQKTTEKFQQLGDKIASSDAYQKASGAARSAAGKAVAAASAAGTSLKGRFSNLRTTNAFKNFETKIGGAYSSIKEKMGGGARGANGEDGAGALGDQIPEGEVDGDGETELMRQSPSKPGEKA